MTEPTSNKGIEQKKIEEYVNVMVKILSTVYVPGDSMATHLNVAENISFLLTKLEYLKHKN